MQDLNNSIIIADRIFHPLLLKEKARNPHAEIKLLTKDDVIEKLCISFGESALATVISKCDIEYSKAKKYLKLLRTCGYGNDENLKEIFNVLLNSNCVKEANIYGQYFFKGKNVFLVELDEDYELQNIIKRNGINYDFLHIEDLVSPKNELDKDFKFYTFTTKSLQFSYIFSKIRKICMENPEIKERLKILIKDEYDLFYVNLYSRLFNIPIISTVKETLRQNVKISAVVSQIFKDKNFNILSKNDLSEEESIIKEIVDNYMLSQLVFEKAYGNLLEILSSLSTKDVSSNKGVIVTDSFVIDDDSYYFVTNFQYDIFYKVYADKNVRSDKEIAQLGGNTSYNLTDLDRRNKLAFFKFSNLLLVSRVSQHLTDSIYDSQFIDEFKLTKNRPLDEILNDGIYTTDSEKINICDQYDKSFYSEPVGEFNAYDHSFKGINNPELLDKNIWSLTKLEGYVNCPFKYLLDSVLPREQNEKYAAYQGTLIHSFFEDYYKPDFDFETSFARGKKAFIDQTTKDGTQIDERYEVYLRIIKYRLQKVVNSFDKAKKDILIDKDNTELNELEVNWKLKGSDNREYNFYGKIDKVLVTQSDDTFEKYFTVVDYKSGAESFVLEDVKYGKSIQLPIYSLALLDQENKVKYVPDMEFGGFGIQKVYASRINKLFYKDDLASEKNFYEYTALSGILSGSKTYLKTVNNIEIGEAKKIFYANYKKGFFAEEKGEDDSKYGVYKKQYKDFKKLCDYEDLMECSIQSTLSIVNLIQHGEFGIYPTSFEPSKFDIKQLACKYCNYKNVCYRKKSDAVDYNDYVTAYEIIKKWSASALAELYASEIINAFDNQNETDLVRFERFQMKPALYLDRNYRDNFFKYFDKSFRKILNDEEFLNYKDAIINRFELLRKECC